MAQGGILGNGCKAAYSLASPITWVQIDQLVDLVFPTWVGDDVNIDTHLTTNKLHRNMPGMIAVGNPSVTVLTDLDPATSPDQDALRQYNASGENLWFRFEVPVNRAKTSFRGIEFQAGVKSFSPATPIADKQTTVFELNFSGDDIGWDIAAGASEIT
jgi:hypothetical protein